MKRRHLLACTLAAATAGCLGRFSIDGSVGGDPNGEPSSTDSTNSTVDDGTDSNTDDSEYAPRYHLLVEPPVSSPGDDPVCSISDLPKTAGDELSRAIESTNFSTDDPIHYELEGKPALLETECYAQYVDVDGEYYWVEVVVSSG